MCGIWGVERKGCYDWEGSNFVLADRAGYTYAEATMVSGGFLIGVAGV